MRFPRSCVLTNLGIRLVDKEVLEAADAFGASHSQKLFGVQIPLALPNIFAGVNQTIMMSLAMVVIASMIGVKGLGVPVLRAISNQYLAPGPDERARDRGARHHLRPHRAGIRKEHSEAPEGWAPTLTSRSRSGTFTRFSIQTLALSH